MVIMIKTTVLNVKIDKDLKEQTQALASTMGLPVSTVVAAGLREFVRTRAITFSEPPRLRPEVEAELVALSLAAKTGQGMSPVFSNAEDAFVWLDQ